VIDMYRQTPAPQIKFTHIIPHDGLGGVEVAAQFTNRIETPAFVFNIDYIYAELSQATGDKQTYALWPLVSKAIAVVRSQPDVLVLSLWRACIVGLMVKAMRPRIKLILFLHNTHDAHWMDKLFTRMAARFCVELWVDCERTAKVRLPTLPMVPLRIVSYVTKRTKGFSRSGMPTPRFAFWGRLAPSKNVARAIGIFQRIAATRPDARFTIIGPDGGDLDKLKEASRSSGVGHQVSFTGPVPHDQLTSAIGNASFFIQTSLW
jgi:glycosyltransferase involved in cell wall biosynthesis